MPNSCLQSIGTDDRKRAISHELSQLHFATIATDVELSHPDVLKLPLDLLPSLGVGFASMPQALRTITQTITTSGQGLLKATHSDGTPFAFSELLRFKDGSGAMGSGHIGGATGFEQARLHEVGNLVSQSTITVPYNPAMIAMAITLAQINQKLDGIQNTLNELFDYLRLKDKASIRASLETLSAVFNDYGFNWNNDHFKHAKYTLVQTINHSSRQHIIELRAQLAKHANKKSPLELRRQSEAAANEILDLLREYRLALYLFAFSTFLGVVLLENYDESYLQSQSDDIRKKTLEYRETYTKCFDTISSRSNRSFSSVVMGGISKGIHGLGRAVEKTPAGDATPIDEVLIAASKDLETHNMEKNASIAKQLIEVKDPGVSSFAESIRSISRIYNQPAQLLMDSEAIYLLPEGC